MCYKHRQPFKLLNMSSIANIGINGNAPRQPKCRDKRIILSQREIEFKVKGYVTRVINNAAEGCCFVRQKTIRKSIGCGNQKIVEALRSLVGRGELIRVDMPNGKRKNPKPFYYLPTPKNGSSSLIDCCVRGTINRTWNISNLEKWKGLNRLEQIEAYIDAGMLVTPLIERGKKPLRNWTREKLRKMSKKSLMNFFAENPGLNVGAYMPDDIVCVDVDDAEAFYKITGGEDFDTLRVSNSGRGFHLYFRNDKGICNHNDTAKVMDFKTNGLVMVLPPSIHASGRPYEWKDLIEPIETPDAIKNYFDSRNERKATTQVGEPTSAKPNSPALSKSTILREGCRYPSLWRKGRSLKWKKGKDAVAQELREYNAACCKPPLTESRMRSLIHDVYNGKDRPDWLANRKASANT